MPLDAFIEATMALLATDADEIWSAAPQMRSESEPRHAW